MQCAVVHTAMIKAVHTVVIKLTVVNATDAIVVVRIVSHTPPVVPAVTVAASVPQLNVAVTEAVPEVRVVVDVFFLVRRGEVVAACSRCGRGQHKKDSDCPAKGKQCHGCGMYGHFSACCRSKQVQAVDAEEEDEVYYVDAVHVQGTEPAWYTELSLRSHNIKFKIDTGADVTIIPKSLFQTLTPCPTLVPPFVVLVVLCLGWDCSGRSLLVVLCLGWDCSGRSLLVVLCLGWDCSGRSLLVVLCLGWHCSGRSLLVVLCLGWHCSGRSLKSIVNSSSSTFTLSTTRQTAYSAEKLANA